MTRLTPVIHYTAGENRARCLVSILIVLLKVVGSIWGRVIAPRSGGEVRAQALERGLLELLHGGLHLGRQTADQSGKHLELRE